MFSEDEGGGEDMEIDEFLAAAKLRLEEQVRQTIAAHRDDPSKDAEKEEEEELRDRRGTRGERGARHRWLGATAAGDPLGDAPPLLRHPPTPEETATPAVAGLLGHCHLEMARSVLGPFPLSASSEEGREGPLDLLA